jgi:hypothetical protein
MMIVPFLLHKQTTYIDDGQDGLTVSSDRYYVFGVRVPRTVWNAVWDVWAAVTVRRS